MLLIIIVVNCKLGCLILIDNILKNQK